jgi:hypothetical protein
MVPVLVVTFAVLLHRPDPPPPGYRFPRPADVTGDWATFRATAPEPFHVRDDFDGDGSQDDGWLLLSESEDRWAFFVARGARSGQLHWEMLESGLGPVQEFGLEIVRPGRYKTACGKGYFECAVDETDELRLKRPAIDFFMFESSSTFYWWDSGRKAWRKTRISD